MDWRPIETASAVGKIRLMFWTKYGRVVVGYRVSGTNDVISEESSQYQATHWMPLPAPPKHD